MQSVLGELHPDVESDPAIQTKLTYGKTIHLIAAAWFRALPSFAINEERVDGAAFGLPGVRGRLDFRLGRSIVELKTTDEPEVSRESVLNGKPQDLEQLLLYAILTSRTAEPHWLVYYHSGRARPFTVFRAKLLNSSPLTDVFSRRLGAMNRAFESHNLVELERCHYLRTGCDMDLQHRCPCTTLPPPNVSHLPPNVELTEAPEFAAELERARNDAVRGGRVGMGVWDLFVPRQAYLKNLGLSLGSFRAEDDKYALRRYIEHSIDESNLVGAEALLNVGDTYVGRSRTLRITESSKDGRPVNTELPCIVRAMRGSPRDGWLPPAFAAQLAVHCAARNSKEGLLILGLVEHPGELLCFRIVFSDTDRIHELVAARLSLISDAVSRGDSTALLKCPRFAMEGCGSACLCRPSVNSGPAD